MKIKKIKKIEKEKTYDLNIKDNHNYFISENDISVHNSGKDFSKTDRSAAYLARYIAKNIIETGVAEKCKVEIAYMIGKKEPASLNVDTFGDYDDKLLIEIVKKVFPLEPNDIINHFNLKSPIFSKTAGGHYGNDEFPWEKTDMVDKIKTYLKE